MSTIYSLHLIISLVFSNNINPLSYNQTQFWKYVNCRSKKDHAIFFQLQRHCSFNWQLLWQLLWQLKMSKSLAVNGNNGKCKLQSSCHYYVSRYMRTVTDLISQLVRCYLFSSPQIGCLCCPTFSLLPKFPIVFLAPFPRLCFSEIWVLIQNQNDFYLLKSKSLFACPKE